MSKYISFFGSNARKLYVQNIYQALTLPSKSVIQYRYQTKYVSQDILKYKNEYINKKGLIFYYYNPELKDVYKGTIDNCKTSIAIPIREVRIIDIQINEEIDQINFYLELNEFIRVEDYKINNEEDVKLLKDTFVKELTFKHRKLMTWKEKIHEVKDYFGEIQFFYINNIKMKGKKASNHLVYDKEEYRTNLTLYEDSSYIFDFLTYDKTAGEAPIKIETEETYIKANNSLETGTILNSKRIVFFTRTMDFKRDSSFIKFESDKSGFPVTLTVNLKKRRSKSLFFALASSILFISFPIVNLIANDKIFLNGKPMTINLCFIIILTFLIFLCTYILHLNYNKK